VFGMGTGVAPSA